MHESTVRPANGDGNGFLSGIPVWAKVISIVGVPGAIAFYLVWLVGQTIPNVLAEVTSLKSEMTHNQELQRENIQRTAELTRLLQRICSRVSSTDAERQQCFDR